MRHSKCIPCSFLQVFFGFILFRYIACECKLPVDFPDGKITYKCPSDANRTVAEDLYVLEVKCSSGFQLIGSPYIMCVDEDWIPAMPFCAKIECPKPPDIPNATYLQVKSAGEKLRMLRSTAVYTCNEGYELNYSEQFSLHCVMSRKHRAAVWRGKLPTCNGRKSCSDIGVSEFGSRKGECCISGTSLQFNCNKGYELVGEASIHCLPSGNWTSSRPLCKPSEEHCELPPTIPHGTVIGVKKGDYYVPQEKAIVLCDLGYKHEGPEYVLCEEGGEWDSEFGECIEILCDMPLLLNHGKILELQSSNQTSFPYNFKITYVCNENYRLYGASKRVCKRRGWTRKSPACKRMSETEKETKPQKESENLTIVLYFVFDASTSIGLHNFRKSIKFAKAFVGKVGISDNRIRAGALTFSSRAEESFSPLSFNRTKEVVEALDRIEYKGGRGKNITSAFTLLKTEAFPLVDENLGKKNVQYVIFLITDGKVNTGGNPGYETQVLKEMGVEIVCIGITSDVRTDVLHSFATTSKNTNGDDRSNVFVLDKYSSMAWVVQDIRNGRIDYTECGLGLENLVNNNRERNIDSRISTEPWPWMAALFLENDEEIPPKYELGCAGTIIHQKFILTAAHCLCKRARNGSLVVRNKKSIIMKLGLTGSRNETYLQEFGVINMFIHPEYRHGVSYDYDIALLQIEKPAVYNAFVRPICLPPEKLPDESPLYKPQSTAWAAGWARDATVGNGNERKTSYKLKEIPLPIQPKDRCIESLRESDLNVSYFTDRMLCAGDETGSNICEVSSGGTLMQPQLNYEDCMFWTQVGIVTWDCGIEYGYGFYTHLHRFVPWIYDSIENALRAMDQ